MSKAFGMPPDSKDKHQVGLGLHHVPHKTVVTSMAMTFEFEFESREKNKNKNENEKNA